MVIILGTLIDHDQKKIVITVSLVTLGLILGITIILQIVYTFQAGFLQWVHLFAIAPLLVILVPFALLIHWERTTYLEPKIRVITALLVILMVLMSGVALAYVFGVYYPGKNCGSDNLYRREDDKCFEPIKCMGGPNTCVAWDKNSHPRCGRYNSTSNICLINR
ncbi:cytochrome c oxidase subunit 6C [Acrasis kona]|uniref:Cytochrome c oxidase subunit 6C n=1 Tax=Acrasis kona TaxID=1008807 RepID=A0AAW2YW46_9EUKA